MAVIWFRSLPLFGKYASTFHLSTEI